MAGQTVAVWLEDKSSGPAVYAQPYQFDGVPSHVADFAPKLEVTLFPNPAWDRMQLVLNSNRSDDWMLEALNAAGQQVFSCALVIQPGENRHSFDVSEWPEGLYSLRGSAEDGMKVLVTSFLVSH